jgi:hypothetical protein
MKITIWIRARQDNPRKVEIRTDFKYESRDTPALQTFCHRIIAAIENGGAGETVEAQGKSL